MTNIKIVKIIFLIYNFQYGQNWFLKTFMLKIPPGKGHGPT